MIARVLFLVLLFLPLPAMAQEFSLPNPPQIFRVTFDDIAKECTGLGTSNEECEIVIPWIGNYISQLYIFAVGVSTILAVLVIMVAGLMWATAGGNKGQTETARSYINGAVLGLTLMLGSYTLLYLINPKLVEFDGVKLKVVRNEPLVQADIISKSQSCDWQNRFNDGRGIAMFDNHVNQCSNGGEQGTGCDPSKKDGDQVCCCKSLRVAENLNSLQLNHATEEIARLISFVNSNRICSDGTNCGVVVTSISDNNILITNTDGTPVCKPWLSPGSQGNCQHSATSRHYGLLRNLGTQPDNLTAFSCAVDFRARSEDDCKEIRKAIEASGIEVDYENVGVDKKGCELEAYGGPHFHVSLKNCR